MRDEFTMAVKELLAKRVGYRCSNPKCRQLTAGPQTDPCKVINVGVAAHITAAALKGPRYEELLTDEQRRASENGIWLCQKCAKLIDNDQVRYTVEKLREWKHQAEAAALSEVEGGAQSVERGPNMVKLEKIMPDLLDEMRRDLTEYPLRRELVLLKKSWVYMGKGNELVYYYDDHPELDNKFIILENYGLVDEITYNNVKRFVLSEELVDYLAG